MNFLHTDCMGVVPPPHIAARSCHLPDPSREGAIAAASAHPDGRRVCWDGIPPIAGAPHSTSLATILVFLDAIVLNKPEVMIGQVASRVAAATLELIDETTRELIAGQLNAFATLARKVKA